MKEYSFLIAILIFLAPLAASQETTGLFEDEIDVEISPENPSLIDKSGVIAIKFDEKVSSPEIDFSIENGRIVDINSPKFESKTIKKRTASISAGKIFYQGGFILVEVKGENPKLDIKISSANKEDTRATVEFSKKSKSRRSLLAEQAESRARTASNFADIYSGLYEDSEEIERDMILGLKDGFIQTAKLAKMSGNVFSLSWKTYKYTTDEGGAGHKFYRISNTMFKDYDSLATYHLQEGMFGRFSEIQKEFEEVSNKQKQEAIYWRNGQRSKLVKNLESQIREELWYHSGPSFGGNILKILGSEGNTILEGSSAEDLGDSTSVYIRGENSHIREDLLPLARPPKPEIEKSGDLNFNGNGESTLEFKVKNKGGLAKKGYLTFSHSKNLEIEDVRLISGNNEFSVYKSKPGDTIYSSSGKIKAKYPLTDILEKYDSPGTNTYEIIIKKNSGGGAWIKYRAAMKPEIDMGGGYYRTPKNGVTDQQGRTSTELKTGNENPSNPRPKASINYEPKQPSTGQEITLYCESEGECRWDIGNNGEIDGTGNQYKLNIESDKTVRLEVERNGKTDSTRKTIKVKQATKEFYKIEDEKDDIRCVDNSGPYNVIESYNSLDECKSSIEEDGVDGGENKTTNQTETVKISSCEDLKNTNYDADRGHFLTSDIACGELKPLGRLSGTFNGQGHTISNLEIEGEHNVGLFSGIGNDGVVKNLKLEDFEISGNGPVGGITGENNGKIIRVKVSGRIQHSNGGISRHLGGIAGRNKGEIRRSYSTSSVSGYRDPPTANTQGSGDVLIGGIAGRNNGIIKNVYSKGDITGHRDIGGITGSNLGNIEQVFTRAVVRGNKRTGYVAGSNSGEVANSYTVNKSDYYDTEMLQTKNTKPITGKEALEKNTYKNFDFQNDWKMPKKGYPHPRINLINSSNKSNTDNKSKSPSEPEHSLELSSKPELNKKVLIRLNTADSEISDIKWTVNSQEFNDKGKSFSYNFDQKGEYQIKVSYQTSSGSTRALNRTIKVNGTSKQNVDQRIIKECREIRKEGVWEIKSNLIGDKGKNCIDIRKENVTIEGNNNHIKVGEESAGIAIYKKDIEIRNLAVSGGRDGIVNNLEIESREKSFEQNKVTEKDNRDQLNNKEPVENVDDSAEANSLVNSAYERLTDFVSIISFSNPSESSSSKNQNDEKESEKEGTVNNDDKETLQNGHVRLNSSIIIEDVRLESNLRGIKTESGLKIINSTIADNNKGIELYGKQNTLESNLIKDNKIGINAPDIDGLNKVSDNKIIGNEEAGIMISNEFIISNNTVKNNQKYGIFIDSNNTVSNNRVLRNKDTGIAVTGTSNLIDNSMIEENGRFGYRALNERVGSNTISDVEIKNNNGVGIRVEKQSTIKNSHIESNEDAGVQINGGNAVKNEIINDSILNRGTENNELRNNIIENGSITVYESKSMRIEQNEVALDSIHSPIYVKDSEDIKLNNNKVILPITELNGNKFRMGYQYSINRESKATITKEINGREIKISGTNIDLKFSDKKWNNDWQQETIGFEVLNPVVEVEADSDYPDKDSNAKINFSTSIKNNSDKYRLLKLRGDEFEVVDNISKNKLQYSEKIIKENTEFSFLIAKNTSQNTNLDEKNLNLSRKTESSINAQIRHANSGKPSTVGPDGDKALFSNKILLFSDKRFEVKEDYSILIKNVNTGKELRINNLESFELGPSRSTRFVIRTSQGDKHSDPKIRQYSSNFQNEVDVSIDTDEKVLRKGRDHYQISILDSKDRYINQTGYEKYAFNYHPDMEYSETGDKVRISIASGGFSNEIKPKLTVGEKEKWMKYNAERDRFYADIDPQKFSKDTLNWNVRFKEKKTDKWYKYQLQVGSKFLRPLDHEIDYVKKIKLN